MRHPIVAFLGILAVTAFFGAPTPARAQNYPWCEFIGSGFDGGGQNCGFISFEQCMETARGNGGICSQNTTYVPPPGEHAGTAPRAHTKRKPAKNS